MTTPRGDSDRPGLIVRKATLEPCDVTSIERIKVTTAARTILDCAAILPPDEDDRLEAMCAEASPKRRQAAGPPRADRAQPGQAGRRPARETPRPPRSPARPKRELERKLLRLVRASDLPEPEVNAWVVGKERDLVWREQRVVVEADCYTFHCDAADLGEGHRQDQRAPALGYVVLRFTWFDVTERPTWVIDKIREALVSERMSDAKRPPLPGRASRFSPASGQRALRRRRADGGRR